MGSFGMPSGEMNITFQNEEVQTRKKQLQDLENATVLNRKKSDDFTKTMAVKLNKINLEINELKNKTALSSGALVDGFSKKASLLNDRKQNLETTQELWKDFLEKLEKRKILLNEILTNIQSSQQIDYKAVYTWKEFRDAQLKTSEAAHKIDLEKARREALKKQKFAEKETMDSVLKQVDVKNKEKEKVLSQGEDSGDKNVVKKSSAAIKVEGDLLDQEILLLSEKAEYYHLKIDKIEQEEILRDDEIDLSQKKLNAQKDFLNVVEKRLIIDLNDAEIAKAEWTNSATKTSLLKDELNSQIEPKKYEKEKLALELDYLNERLKKIREGGKKNYAASAVVKSEIHKTTNQISLLESEIKLLEAKKTLTNLVIRDKELQYIMVDLRYKLQRLLEKFDLEEYLANFKNQKDLEQSTFKALKDQRVEAIATLVESNREIENIKAKENKLKNKKVAFFRNAQNSLQETLSNYEQSRKALIEQLGVTQSFLAVNQDLIASQEKILNRLELIIADIESRYRQLSMWRRSPKAISIDSLWKAFLSAEVFFKRLFWQTPEHFALNSVWSSVKNLTLNDYIFLIFALFFFLLAFIGLRLMLLFAQRRIAIFLELYQQHKRLLYINVVAAFINFAVGHFSLLFTWLFIYLHMFFNFKFIFSGLRFLAAPYYQAIFYMISIPILVFLSHSFLDGLRELNQKLSYILFAEKFQNKFLWLLTVVFYSSVILLPLRKAFLSYPDLPGDFAVVVMAAYSLILVVIFLLFFSKDDVLKLIPSNTPFFIWLERKIEKYYYPFFFFFMGLLILSNSYVGYSNLAWYLLFAVPASFTLIYALFLTHHYLRKYAVFIFMKEEDDEIIDKFEHAKTYYGFFVILSFFVLFLATFFLLARIWGFEYTPADIWKTLSETWVIPFGGGHVFGFFQFVTLMLFMFSGFFASSLVHKFVLNKLFDILRSEPGIQNTISRITHYSIIGLSISMGFAAIHLEQVIFYIGGLLAIAIGWASKDFVSDFIAGFIVLIERPLEIGNYVKIDDVEGTVHKVSARSTTIITSRNHSIVIPNKDLINKFIDNWSYSKFAVGFEVYIRVDHKSDPELVKKVLITVLQSNMAVLKVPNVVVRLEEIEPDAFYFLTRAFISTRRIKDQWEMAAALRMEIVKAFRAHNIELAKPQRVIGMNIDENATQSKSIEIKFGK